MGHCTSRPGAAGSTASAGAPWSCRRPPPPALECPPSSRQALPASLQLHGHALRPCGCPYLGHLHKLALHRVLQGHEPRAVRRQQAAGGGFPSVGPAGFPEAPPASLIALQHPEVRKEVPLSRPGKRDKAASGPAANGCRRSGETRGGAREPIPHGRSAKGKLPQSPATSPATRGLVAACGSHPWLSHGNMDINHIFMTSRARPPVPLHPSAPECVYRHAEGLVRSDRGNVARRRRFGSFCEDG